MFIDDKRRALVRLLAGGVIGVAVLIPLGGLFNDIVSGGLISMGFHTPFRLVSADLTLLLGSAPLAFAVQLTLYFLLGAVVGVSTLPFAGDGPTLILRSLAHFALTAGALTLTCTLLGWAWSWQAMAVYLVLLAAVYLLIWLGRWVGWYAEVSAIREKLGLDPGPSPLKWRETLPYLPFALLLCLALPMALRLLDAADVPVLSGLLYPYLLLPVGGFFSGLSLGKRQGLCLLYPVLCALCALVFIPLARLVSNMADWPLLPIAAGFSLAGILAGAAWRKIRDQRSR